MLRLALKLLVLGAAALVAALTSRPPELFPDRSVLQLPQPVYYGLAPEVDPQIFGDPDDLKVFYATRWKDGFHRAEGDLEDFLKSDGTIDASLLMSLGTSGADPFARQILEETGQSYNSALTLRNVRTRRDMIIAFNQVGAVSSGQVQVDNFVWRGHAGLIYEPTTGPARSTIVFLGGTSGGVGYQVLALWAANGAKVISLPWVQGGTQTPDCLHEVDLDILRAEVEEIYRRHSALGPVSIVGHSGGADAALMIANETSLPFSTVHAIAPTAWHFNGSQGIGCLFPSSPWKLNGRPVPYIMNFPKELNSIFGLARRELGILSQNSLAVDSLDRATDDESESLRYKVENIGAEVYLYAGGLDDLTPSAISVDTLCRRIKNVVCYNRKLAGHDLLGSPSQSVFCKSPMESLKGISRETYCRETSIARSHVFRSVLDHAVLADRT